MIQSPAPATFIGAQKADHQRLTATAVFGGLAQPNAQLLIAGRCGAVTCTAMTYADRRGVWKATLRLTTRPKQRQVLVAVGYWQGLEPPARVSTRLALGGPLPAPDPFASASAGLTPTPGQRQLIMIGDSLAIGAADALQGALWDWQVRTEAQIGSPLVEGMDILGHTRVTDPSAVLGFSLFTNDPPTELAALETAVRASLARVPPRGCAIWATIARPPSGRVSYAAANALLRRMAAEPASSGRLIVADWARTVHAHHSLLSSDRVHPTQQGRLVRAALFARAARSCPG